MGTLKKYLQRISESKVLTWIRNIIGRASGALKSNTIEMISIGILSIALIIVIWQYNTLISGEVSCTTYIRLVRCNGIQYNISEDSLLQIYHIPNGIDEIRLTLNFTTPEDSGAGCLNLIHDGKWELKEDTSMAVEQQFSKDMGDGITKRNYLINFPDKGRAYLQQMFKANIFNEGPDEIHANVRISEFPKSLIRKIFVLFYGVNKFEIKVASPKPNSIAPNTIRPIVLKYNYDLYSDEYYEGINIIGYSSKVLRKARRLEFKLGVAMALIASALATLFIDLLRKKRMPFTKK